MKLSQNFLIFSSKSSQISNFSCIYYFKYSNDSSQFFFHTFCKFLSSTFYKHPQNFLQLHSNNNSCVSLKLEFCLDFLMILLYLNFFHAFRRVFTCLPYVISVFSYISLKYVSNILEFFFLSTSLKILQFPANFMKYFFFYIISLTVSLISYTILKSFKYPKIFFSKLSRNFSKTIS